jgi:Zn-dependent membrane protease YugP
MFFDPRYLVIVLISVVLGAVTQRYIKTTFARYSQVRPTSGLTGAQVAERILKANDIHALPGMATGRTSVAVVGIGGDLSDHYDPRKGIVSLSEGVYGIPSLAANAVAAHEVGHALQTAQGYLWGRVRTALVPVVNFGSQAAGILIIMGFFTQLLMLIWVGIACYAIAVVFQIVTLPVELNASSRALAQLRQTGLLSESELPGARKVLTAAALTYVASALISILYLLYYLSFARRR